VPIIDDFVKPLPPVAIKKSLPQLLKKAEGKLLMHPSGSFPVSFL
jgi:hypothetical protein